VVILITGVLGKTFPTFVHPWKLNQLYVLQVLAFTSVQLYLGVLLIFVQLAEY
jgi:hypothetical protein